MEIHDLVLEVTRRCNMRCEHCLRGPVQAKDMSKEIINRSISKFDSIGTLTITGGEPTLVPNLLQHIAYTLQFNKDTEVNNLYMVTNGKTIKEGVFKAIRHIMLFCNDNNCSRIDISNDQFHNLSSKKNWDRWIEWAEEIVYDVRGKHHDWDDYPLVGYKWRNERIFNVIQMGMAAINGVGENSLKISGINDSELLYINIYGDIYPACDLSYKVQKVRRDLCLGNILDPKLDLEAAIEKFNIRTSEFNLSVVETI